MKLNNISKNYNDKKVLSEINLELDNSRMIFILGKSGAGKTTLLNVLGCLDNASQGEIIYNEVKLDEAKAIDRFRANEISYIFQEFNLMPSYSVFDNIKFAMNIQNKEINEIEIESRIIKILKNLNIEDIKDREIHFLSGGEKQRVAIARAIARNTDIILADEPTGNIDEDNAKICIELLKELSKEKLVIVVSHNKELAEKYADITYELVDGKLQVIKEESKEKEINKQHISQNKNANSPKIKLKTILNYSYKNFRLNKKKLIINLVLLSFSLLAICMAFSLYDLTAETQQDINIECLEADYIKIYNDIKIDYEYGSRASAPLDIVAADGVEYVQNELSTKDIVYYHRVSFKYFVNDEDKSLFYIPVNINQFWEDRLQDHIIGKFIENDNEIIIAEQDALAYFGTLDCLNETITIVSQSQLYDMTVVGINTSKTKIPPLKSYVSSNFLDDIYISKNEKTYFEVLGVPLGFEFKNIDEFDKNMIYGRQVQSINEIVVPSIVAGEILQKAFPDYEFNTEDVVTLNFPQYMLDTLDDAIIDTNMNNKEFDLVGVYETDIENPTTEVFVHQDIIDNYVNYFSYTRIDAYLTDNSIGNLEKQIDKLNSYSLGAESVLLEYQEDLMKNIKNFVSTLIAAFVAISFFAVFSIMSYSKLNILEKRYELGLLRSLGARKRDIINITLIDNILVSIISSLIAFIFYLIIVQFIIHKEGIYFTFLSIVWWTLPLILGVSFVIAVISALPYGLKIAKTPPAIIMKKD